MNKISPFKSTRITLKSPHYLSDKEGDNVLHYSISVNQVENIYTKIGELQEKVSELEKELGIK